MSTRNTAKTREQIDTWLAERLDERARTWLAGARSEIAAGPGGGRFGALVSQASRFARNEDLKLGPLDLAHAQESLPGWNPSRWTLLETLRVALILAREDQETDAFVADLESAFEYADVGELCALYRSLAHLPQGERFAWRAGEGCRTNMTAVFEAVACDTPYPAGNLDDVAWKQLLVKAIFIGVSLWRVQGLDDRLSPDLARMMLDLVEERRSAGRAISPELWLALGAHGGERAQAALEQELECGDTTGKRAALFALCRAGAGERVLEILSAGTCDEHLDDAARDILRAASAGSHAQTVWPELDPST